MPESITAIPPTIAASRAAPARSTTVARSAPPGTLAGLGAIMVWSWFSTLVSWAGAVPPFQLSAIAFAIAAVATAAWSAVSPGGPAPTAGRTSPLAWLACVGGLFGNHALYFAALQHAPPAEAGLLNYLWPLLIVLGSAFLPGERLRVMQVVGAFCGFAGVATLAWGQAGGLGFDPANRLGYACGLGAAVVWAAYSLLARVLGPVPATAFGGCCLATATLSAACHVACEQTVVPRTVGQWAAILAIGLGPVGTACRLWDIGIRRGDIRLLGIASFATPVLSTLLLILFRLATASPLLLAACGLIGGGRPWRRSPRPPTRTIFHAPRDCLHQP